MAASAPRKGDSGVTAVERTTGGGVENPDSYSAESTSMSMLLWLLSNESTVAGLVIVEEEVEIGFVQWNQTAK